MENERKNRPEHHGAQGNVKRLIGCASMTSSSSRLPFSKKDWILTISMTRSKIHL